MNNVKLVSITSPLISEKELTEEQLIVYIARVSNPNNQLNTDTAENLIKYMVSHNHWSPFEMCDMTVEIKTSRAIAQQIVRHRSFSFQEFSQRYSRANEIVPIQLRYQSEKNRQSSVSLLNSEDNSYFNKRISDLISLSQEIYEEMLDRNVAKECARMILPLATQTTIYMKGSVRSWIHYLQIRTTKETQLEHREIASQIADIFNSKFPIICKSINL